jgi:hypothetical protein
MTNTQMILGGLALLVLLRRRSPLSTLPQQTIRDYMNDPTNWGSDMWSRLYGEDLAMVGGQHNAQSGLTVYRVTDNSMGFIGSAAR